MDILLYIPVRGLGPRWQNGRLLTESLHDGGGGVRTEIHRGIRRMPTGSFTRQARHLLKNEFGRVRL